MTFKKYIYAIAQSERAYRGSFFLLHLKLVPQNIHKQSCPECCGRFHFYTNQETECIRQYLQWKIIHWSIVYILCPLLNQGLIAVFTLETDHQSETGYLLDNSRLRQILPFHFQSKTYQYLSQARIIQQIKRMDKVRRIVHPKLRLNFGWTIRLTLSFCFSVNFDGFWRWIIRLRRIIRF